jgi:hypothetical protein
MEEIESILSEHLGRNISKFCILPFLDLREVYSEVNMKRLVVMKQLRRAMPAKPDANLFSFRFADYKRHSWPSTFFSHICINCHLHFVIASRLLNQCKQCAHEKYILELEESRKHKKKFRY